MSDEPRPPRQVTIRPAGWVVIALALGGVCWLVWHFGAPHIKPLLQRPSDEEIAPPPAPATSRTGAEAEKAEPAEEQAEPSPALGRQLFPSRAKPLPAPSPLFPRVALSPLAGWPSMPVGASEAPSEREALRRLARAEADYAVVSVVALASMPEVTAAGARAVWSLGASRDTARLFPSCKANALRKETLGAVKGTPGHLELLAAFADSNAPNIVLFEQDSELAATVSEGAITGGIRLDEGEQCRVLPAAVSTLLVVRGPSVNTDGAEVSAIAASAPSTVSPEEVASFFDETRTIPGGFFDVYAKSQQVWKRVGLVSSTTPASHAIDRSLLGPPQALVAEPTKQPLLPSTAQRQEEPPPPRPEFGRPSWPDLH